MPGDSIFNSVGVRNYPDWATGLTATTQTLSLGFYDQIRAALTDGRDASAVPQRGRGVALGERNLKGLALGFRRAARSGLLTLIDNVPRRLRPLVMLTPRSLRQPRSWQLRLPRKQNSSLSTTRCRLISRRAKLQLAIFARSLYIAGVEPEIVSKLEAVQSGDPIAYTLLRSYPGLSANRNADAINRAIDLLAEVGASADSELPMR